MSSLTDYLLREYLQTRQQTVNNQHQLMTEDRQFRMRQQEMNNNVVAQATQTFIQVAQQHALKMKELGATQEKVGRAATVAKVDPSTIDMSNPLAVGILEGQAVVQQNMDEEAGKSARNQADIDAQNQRFKEGLSFKERHPPGQSTKTPDQLDKNKTAAQQAAVNLFTTKFKSDINAAAALSKDPNAPASKRSAAKAKLDYYTSLSATITDLASAQAAIDQASKDLGAAPASTGVQKPANLLGR